MYCTCVVDFASSNKNYLQSYFTGAELFAKRRKKSENWIIDENNVKSVESFQATNTITMSQNTLSKLPPPSYLKDSTHRVENVQKMNEIQVSI